jgi:glycosyltransferase involved in cell wall biosynthesis
MQHVKVLIYEPYPFKIYGNTRYLISIFKHINRARFSLFLVTPFNDGVLNIINDLHGRFVAIPTPSILKRYGGTILTDGFVGKIRTMASLARYSVTLRSFIIKEDIDVVQCHSIRSLLTVGVAAKLTRRPCFWYVKGDLENPLLDRIGYAVADKVLFQCETTKNRKYPELVRKYHDKIRILPNGIDLVEVLCAERADPTKLIDELCLDQRKLNIMFLGQIYAPKGIEYLLEAIVKIHKINPNVALYLVGDHALDAYKGYRKKLNSIIKSGFLNGVVIFTGWRADAVEILSLMDLFVLPSLSEGVPKSIIEAMALGKPVVSTRVGGIPELVRHGETGFIVEPRDSDGLAHAILTLANDKELRTRFGEKARGIAFKYYSIKENIAGLEKIYTELARKSL